MGLLSHAGWTVSAALAAAVISLSAIPDPATGDEMQASIARGGRLYDNWYAEIRDRPPETAHPAYPAGRAYAGDPKTNWRCKECHGWDYRGNGGAYAQGPHATGIKGITAMAGAEPAAIRAVLLDQNHRYGDLMADADLADLAHFVSRGQIDMDPFIDRESLTFKGDASRRRDYYVSICATCHGRDGHKVRSMPALGDVVRNSPWESLHKILNGHPGEGMPALRVLERQILVDILAYAQTLDVGDTLSSIVRGGRLYDNWRREVGGHLGTNTNADFPPNQKHPAYPVDKRYAQDPDSNWRCKECHGWDYRGSEGAYAEGDHFTGIKGIRAMAGADPDAVLAVLNDDTHTFGSILELQDLRDLAQFVSKGQVDMDAYIDRVSGWAKADKTRHQPHYATICAGCHGLDGTGVITMSPLGRIAREDPWQALHKIVNGHPDESMPALRALGMETISGILAYVQTLPQER